MRAGWDEGEAEQRKERQGKEWQGERGGRGDRRCEGARTFPTVSSRSSLVPAAGMSAPSTTTPLTHTWRTFLTSSGERRGVEKGAMKGFQRHTHTHTLLSLDFGLGPLAHTLPPAYSRSFPCLITLFYLLVHALSPRSQCSDDDNEMNKEAFEACLKAWGATKAEISQFYVG